MLKLPSETEPTGDEARPGGSFPPDIDPPYAPFPDGGECMSASVASVETAVTSCPVAKGLAKTTLPGTPFDDHSCELSPLM